MATQRRKLKPDLTTPLANAPLVPEPEFHHNLKAILGVPKQELAEHTRTNPEPPQKRGRRPKPKA